MAQGTRVCRVCGKEYPFCKTYNPNRIFRYQDVACCPEHGAQFLAEAMQVCGSLRPSEEEFLRLHGGIPEDNASEDAPSEPEIEEIEDEEEDEDEDDFEDDEFDEDEEDDID